MSKIQSVLAHYYIVKIGSINSTNTVWQPPPVFKVCSDVSELLIWETDLFWHQQYLCCSAKVLHTAAHHCDVTSKRQPVLLYSELVASFHSAIATLFFRCNVLHSDHFFRHPEILPRCSFVKPWTDTFHHSDAWLNTQTTVCCIDLATREPSEMNEHSIYILILNY